MAKDKQASPPSSTYVTGFCGVGNHERCPAVIKNEANSLIWDCHCRCHAEGNTGWEPPVGQWDHLETEEAFAELDKEFAAMEVPPVHFQLTLDIDDASVEAWAAIFGQEWDMVRMIEGLREVLTKLDTAT